MCAPHTSPSRDRERANPAASAGGAANASKVEAGRGRPSFWRVLTKATVDATAIRLASRRRSRMFSSRLAILYPYPD